jgi:hypothetical protein
MQVSLKSDKNNSGTLHEEQCTFLIIVCLLLLRMRNIADKSCRENQNTVYVQQLPPPPKKKKKNCAVSEMVRIVL